MFVPLMMAVEAAWKFFFDMLQGRVWRSYWRCAQPIGKFSSFRLSFSSLWPVLVMLTSRVISVATVATLLVAICGASPCQSVDAGYVVEGQVEVSHPTQCFAFKKPPMTQELLMIDTAAYDPREGYYVCTNVSGGASGTGCSSELRAKQDSLCLSGVDGTLSTWSIEWKNRASSPTTHFIDHLLAKGDVYE